VSLLQARRTKIRSLFLQIGYDAVTGDLWIDECGIERDGILALNREGALDGAGSRNQRRAGSAAYCWSQKYVSSPFVACGSALVGAAKTMPVHYSRDQQSESIFPLDDPALPKRAMILPLTQVCAGVRTCPKRCVEGGDKIRHDKP
jgi:hypothetical protein